MVQEYKIHRFIKEQGGKTSKKAIYAALGDSADSRRSIDEKLSMMERFGLIIIDGKEVKVK